MRALRLVFVCVVCGALVVLAAGCAGGEETKTGVFEGEVQWSISSDGDDAQSVEQVWIELDDGEKVLASAPGGRPEIGSTVTVKKLSGDEWEVVE